MFHRCSDLIIVDTSGRHKQEDALFEEMRQVAAGGQGHTAVVPQQLRGGSGWMRQAAADSQAARWACHLS